MNKKILEYPLEKRVAILMDFDLTLTEEYQQIVLFKDYLEQIKERYDGKIINGNQVKIKNPIDYFKISDAWGIKYDGLGYIEQMIFDMNNEVLPALSNRDLREYGKQIPLSEGVPDFIQNLREEFKDECYIGFYIISVGLNEMIKGSGIADNFDGISATKLLSLKALHNKFSEEEIKKQLKKYNLSEGADLLDIMPIDSLKYLVQPFSKTASVIDIAKGGSKKRDDFLTNLEFLFKYNNMIYMGDGTSDISSFAYLKKKGATTIGVYENNMNGFLKAWRSPKIMTRLDILAPRNYKKENGLFRRVLVPTISKMVERRCCFPPQIMDMYKKNRIIKDKTTRRLINDIENHAKKCPECELTYSLQFLFPDNSDISNE
ncbi:MAG: hypothetical protein U9Q69_01985 [Nanoarchaeota archaeon]|nr:hypothetical protein [Nanoarchaeota archaeon]